MTCYEETRIGTICLGLLACMAWMAWIIVPGIIATKRRGYPLTTWSKGFD